MDLRMKSLVIVLGTSLIFISGSLGATPVADRVGKGNAQAHCLCQGFLSRHSPVCDTAGQTHPTACDLTSAMQKNTTLGLKCNHACPCQPSPLAPRCTNTMRLGSAAVRSNRKPALKQKLDPQMTKKYCLTDGTEWTRNTVFCALASKPAGVGIRCMGFCKQCKTIIAVCPAKFLQTIPLRDESLSSS